MSNFAQSILSILRVIWSRMANRPKPISIEQQILQLIQSNEAKAEAFRAATLLQLGQIQSEVEQIKSEVDQIISELAPIPETASIANIFSGDSNMADNALVFTVGQTSIDTITPLLADGVTPSGGVVSNVVITFSDPSATFVVNADQTVTWTAVAASTGAVSGSTAATVTDTDGAVSTWNQEFTVQTNAVVPPAQLTQSIVNRFSTPTP
jgi:hypothetical protein